MLQLKCHILCRDFFSVIMYLHVFFLPLSVFFFSQLPPGDALMPMFQNIVTCRFICCCFCPVIVLLELSSFITEDFVHEHAGTGTQFHNLLFSGFSLVWFLSFFSIQLAHFSSYVSMMKCSQLQCLYYYYYFISKIRVYFVC